MCRTDLLEDRRCLCREGFFIEVGIQAGPPKRQQTSLGVVLGRAWVKERQHHKGTALLLPRFVVRVARRPFQVLEDEL